MASAMRAWTMATVSPLVWVLTLLLNPNHYKTRGVLVEEARDSGMWLYICPDECGEAAMSYVELEVPPNCGRGHGKMQLAYAPGI